MDPTVITYRRVSTEEQNISHLGMEAQAAAIAAELDRRGWKATADYTDIASGKTTNGRPGLAAAVEHARRSRGVLVAYRLDRISRSVLDFATLLERRKREGWDLVMLDMPDADTTTADGEFHAGLMVLLAQRERKLIGERTSAALQALKMRGKRLGPKVATPQKVLDRIERERNAGHSWPNIAASLKADGVPTTRGGEWRVSTVQAAYRTRQLDREAAQRKALASAPPIAPANTAANRKRADQT